MYRQNYVDYDHKPRSHLFGPSEEQSSSKTVATNSPVTNQTVPPKRLIKNDYRDVFVREFICDQIIQSIGFNNDIIYFCFYCNSYLRDLQRVRKHVLSDQHNKVCP